MFCPNCSRSINIESIKCPYCNYDLKNVFDEFKQRENEIHRNVEQMAIKRDKKIYAKKIKITNNLFNLSKKKSIKTLIKDYNISDKEWNCLEFKIISQIYLNKISKSTLNNHVKNVIENYEGEYKFKNDILIKNLVNLIRLAGITRFSKYYRNQLNNFGLSLVEGLDVLGLVIEDLCYGEIKLEDLDKKIKNFMKEYISNPARKKHEQKISDAIDKYYQLTGKDYLSPSFETKIVSNNLSFDDAYAIKEKTLKSIIIYDKTEDIEDILNKTIKNPYDNNNIEYDFENYKNNNYRKKPKKRSKKQKNIYVGTFEELGSAEYDYEDQINIEKDVLGDF